MFENPRRGRQARNFTTDVPKILDLKQSSEQIFSENWRWVPLWIALIPVRSAQCTWFMVYRTRNITFEERLFWYMAYRKMSITCETRFFGIWLIERGILHLNRASCSLWLIQRGVLHLKCGCFGIIMAYRTRNITCEARFFGIWLIERGILHYFETSFLWFMTYKTMKVTFKAFLFWYMAYRTGNS